MIGKKLYGLIGYPLGHSFSKNYFTTKFTQEHIADCAYELFEIASITQLPKILQQNPNLCGINVTIPYKQLVIPYLHQTNNLPIDACNCIKIVNGQLIGFNTDVIGFEKSFLEHLQPHHTHALVLGTGGASLAIQYVLAKLNISYQVVSRGHTANLTYADIDANIMAKYHIIINTTPLGTYPNVSECPPIPYAEITSKHYCYDLVYNPATTAFMQAAAYKGATVKNGADMLKIQAAESWEIWNSNVI
jgi:shikimate dehydrogenase